MLPRIIDDLAKELKCNPSKIKLFEEYEHKGFKIRKLVYKKKGYKVTTDALDLQYINIEPFEIPKEPPFWSGYYGEWGMLIAAMAGLWILGVTLIAGVVIALGYWAFSSIFS